MIKITESAQGSWPLILGDLAGLTTEQLTDKHQPCPLCGGEDRYRFDDRDGSGSWFCNQCGGKDQRGGAGNGMDMLMRRTGWSFADAAKRVEQHLGIAGPAKPKPPIRGAESSWRYTDDFYVCRFPGKEIRPLWWDGSKWCWKAPPAPRPLLNLGKLTIADGTILVVEGEKTADAAAKLYPRAIVTTWPSGCKAIDKADWSPLKGRRIILWPDADEPGRQAMDRLSRKLLALGVERLQIVTPPADVPEGWDLADATWTPEEAGDFIKRNVSKPLILDADEAAEAEPDEPESDLPFRALGFDRGYYFYLPSGSSQVIDLSASAHTKLNLLNLAPLNWWQATYTKGNAIDWDRAADSLMSLCIKQGVYDPDRVRGRGAWYDADRVILHLGNRLSVIHPNGKCVDHDIDSPPTSYYFYEHAKHLTGPADEPLDDQHAAEIVAIAQKFKWEQPASAYFLLGWTVLAPVCGALEWRPHVWLTGGAGTGKTTILKNFMRPLLGGIYQAATGGTTEAGLRGTLKSDAIPVVFDEFEQNEHKDKQTVQNVLSLARIASSEGGKIYKGTTTGGANAFEIRSMFCVSSINVALIQKADIDRFCVLALRRDPVPKENWGDFERRILAAATLEAGRKLIARTVKNIPTIRENARIFSAALASRFGQRFGDQHGTLLAGAWSLSPDGGGVIDLESATAWIDTLDWERHQVDENDADEVKCRDTILQQLVDYTTGQKAQLGELVRCVALGRPMRGEVSEDMALVLARWGLRVFRRGLDKVPGTEQPCQCNYIAISHNCRQLNQTLRDTQWSNNAHRAALKRLPGAMALDRPIHFTGVGSQRATLVPFETTEA
jgi:putative DNA primase/helicase